MATQPTNFLTDIKYISDDCADSSVCTSGLIDTMKSNITSCTNYWKSLGTNDNLYSSTKNLTALNIATIWNKSTDGLEEWGGGKWYTDRATTLALGECQQYMVTPSTGADNIYYGVIYDMDHGGCDNNVSGQGTAGGLWQISSWKDTKIKIPSEITECSTDNNVYQNPCCNALATLYHRGDTKPDSTESLPNCPILSQTLNPESYIKSVGTPGKTGGHNPCMNGPFCTKAGDGDWGNNVTYSSNGCPWTDSWNKYGNSRYFDGTGAPDQKENPINADKKVDWDRVATYLTNSRLRPSYYDIALSAAIKLNPTFKPLI